MGRWEQEKSCHRKIIAIFLFIYWLGTLASNWKVALFIFPGLYIFGLFLFVLLPKILDFLTKYFTKCRHGIYGGLTRDKCYACVQEREIAEVNKNKEIQRRKEEVRILREERNRLDKIKKHFQEIRKREKNKIKEEFNLKFENIINVNPFDFEYLIARLFQELGYKVRQTPKSNDGGKDLILRMDNDLIFVEVKKNSETNKIGRPIVQKFHSAIITGKAKKGIIVTTSFFAQTVYEHPAIKSGEIELIDRNKLRGLLISTFGENKIESFKDVCLVCGSEFEHGFSRIDYCKNGHRADYVTFEEFIK